METLGEAWEAEAEAWLRFTRTPERDEYYWRFNWPAFCDLLPPAGRATLDLGCGEGRGGVYLRERGHSVTGIDSSPTLAAAARETGAYDEVAEADAAAMPFPDDAFDLVSAFMALHDMDDLGGVLREAGRVLEPGGRLVAAIVHPIASAREAGDYFESAPYSFASARVDVTFHSMHHSLEAYARGLRAAGLLIEDLREPRPSDEHVREMPEMEKSTRLPSFLHLLAVKA